VQDKNLRNPASCIAEEDYRDYEFILSDLKRNIELSPEQQIERFRADPWAAFSGLKAANGFDLPLSREAQNRFSLIASRGLKELGPSAQTHSFKKVAEALKGELSSMLQSGLVPSAEDAHEIFRSALRNLDAQYVEVTYHVPCSVVAERTYPKFNIGPVAFAFRDQFFTENESAIQQSAADFLNPKVAEILLARTHAFYSEFQWIASIAIPPCDPEISRRRAHRGIQKALDVFKLLVGGQRASHVKQAYDLTTASEYVELVSSPTGAFSLRTGGKMRDAVLNDQWYQQVTEGPAWEHLRAVLLNYHMAWDSLDEIQTRFLDALSWHSDAISEQDPGAKIIKFWTSIERILRASPGNIDTRAAVLSSSTAKEFEKHSRRFEQAYRKRRNDVVHGNANRASESWYSDAVGASEEASKNVLYQYLYAIHQIRALGGTTDRKKLRAWLKALDGAAEKFCKQFRQR
jgi:hypothetical protein